VIQQRKKKGKKGENKVKMKRGPPKMVMSKAWKGQFERSVIRARLETGSSPHSFREHVRGF
jgi:hypothetical protein